MANFIFEAISGSKGPHIWQRSKNVAEAWKVSAVCLSIAISLVIAFLEAGMIPRCLVSFHGVISSLKGLKSELLYIRLAGHFVCNGVVFFEIRLGLKAKDSVSVSACELSRLTASSLSIMFIV